MDTFLSVRIFSDFLRETNENMERELAETIKKLAEKEQELAAKDQRIGDLELKLKAQEKGFKDKMAYLNKMVAKYKRQAEESAAQNAELLLNSHRQNVMRASIEYDKPAKSIDVNAMTHQPADTRVSSASSSFSSTHSSSPRTKLSPKIKPALHPHAPKESRPHSSGKHRQRAKIGTFGVPQGHPILRDSDTVTMRAASGRRLSGQEDEVVPDPKPFLKVTREQQKALRQSSVDIHRQPSKPLPPIAKSAILSGSMQHSSRVDEYGLKPPDRRNPPVVPAPNKANSADFKKLKQRGKRSPQSLEVEMETLALDITKNDVSNLRRAQEYGSD